MSARGGPDREHSGPGRRVGTADGAATPVLLTGRAHSRDGRPGAAPVYEDQQVKVVVFEFAAGDVLAEHAARHPVLVQVVRGAVELTLDERVLHLGPGELVHLTPMLRHRVRATAETTLTVTMLLPPT